MKYLQDGGDASGRFNITYNANGGSSVPSEQTKEVGVDLTLSNEKPIREGYDFQVWSKNSDAAIASYQPGQKYSIDQSMTLYAVWKIKTYQITYHSNAGNEVEVPAVQIKEHFTKEELSAMIPEQEGYNFRGWEPLQRQTMQNTSQGMCMMETKLLICMQYGQRRAI